MKLIPKLLFIILCAITCAGEMLAQGTRIKLTQLEQSKTVDGTKAGQLGLTNNAGDQRYANYVEVNLVPIAYTPDSTGNTDNLSQFVVTPGNYLYYIDWQGNAVRFGAVDSTACDVDWLQISNLSCPDNLTDSIFKYKYASVGARLVWPGAEFLVNDSTSSGIMVVQGFRNARLALYDGSGATWSMIDQGGLSPVWYMPVNANLVWKTTAGTPQSPAGSQVNHFAINTQDSTIQAFRYPNTRVDTNTIANFLYTDPVGKLRSAGIDEIGPAAGLISGGGSFPEVAYFDSPTSITSKTGFQFNPLADQLTVPYLKTDEVAPNLGTWVYMNGDVWIPSTLSISPTAVGPFSLSMNDMTDATALQVGTTAERPIPAIEGLIRYNITDSLFEGYTKGNWEPIATGSGGVVNIYNSNGTISVPGSNRAVLVDSLTELNIEYVNGVGGISIYGGDNAAGENGNATLQSPGSTSYISVGNTGTSMVANNSDQTVSVLFNDGSYGQLMLLQSPSFYLGNFNSDDDTELRLSYEPGLKSVQGSVQNNTFYAREDSAGFDVALSHDALILKPADSLIFLGRNNGQYANGINMQTGVDGNITAMADDGSKLILSEGVKGYFPDAGLFWVRNLTEDIELVFDRIDGYDMNGIPVNYPGVAYRDRYRHLGQYGIDMLSFISVDTIGSAYIQATTAPGQKDIGMYLGTYDPMYAGQVSIDTINGVQILSPTAILGHWGLSGGLFGEDGLNIYGGYGGKEAHINQTLGTLSIGGSENSFAHTYTYSGDPAGIILAQTFADTVGTAYLNLDTHGGGAGKFAKIGVQGQLGASSESWVLMDTVGVEIRTGGTTGNPNDVIINDGGRASWSNSIDLVSGSFSDDLYGQTVLADMIVFAGNYSGTTFTIEANAGTGASAAKVAAQSSDGAGRFSVTTGTGATTGLWVTVTFDVGFTKTPIVQIYPENAGASALNTYINASTTGFEFFINTTPADLTTYEFNYIVIGGNQ